MASILAFNAGFGAGFRHCKPSCHMHQVVEELEVEVIAHARRRLVPAANAPRRRSKFCNVAESRHQGVTMLLERRLGHMYSKNTSVHPKLIPMHLRHTRKSALVI